ncbi:MAG: primosomal protein N' [Candidatus Omnitrophota bacterium]
MIAEVAIPISIALNEQFDYLVPESLTPKVAIGCRVLVPFRTSVILGYVVRLKNHSMFMRQLRPILKNLDSQPILDNELFKMAYKIQKAYFCSLAQAIQAVLPIGVKNTKSACLEDQALPEQTIPHFDFDIKETEELKGEIVLIQDLSNKKRWDKYSALIKKTLNEKKSVIFLVPDHEKIKPAMESLNLGINPFILTSSISAQESLRTWTAIKKAPFSFVLGTRSAVFAPVNNLGLIVLEEEGHFAYRQDQVPHYKAFELALERTKEHKAGLILGSFVLSLDSYYLYKKHKAAYICLKRPEPWPMVRIIDMRQEYVPKGKEKIISKSLEYQIANILQRNEKLLIFVNQKGFSTFLYCPKCKKTQTCPRCSSSLKYHFKEKTVLCPSCSFKTASFDICPICRSTYIKYSGYGLEKVESELTRLFPSVKIQAYENRGAALPAYDIMLATQQFLEDPYLNTYSFDSVCVIACEQMLGHMDFRSTEKTYARLLKLRSCAKNGIILQTHVVENDALKYLKDSEPSAFFKEELKCRKELKLPPVVQMAALNIRSKDEAHAKNKTNMFYKKLKKLPGGCEAFEPMACVPFKVRNNYRYQILIKYKNMDNIQNILWTMTKERKQNVIVTFEP